MRLQLHVAYDVCVLGPRLECAAVLREMAVQAIFGHPGAGLGALLLFESAGALANDTEISA